MTGVTVRAPAKINLQLAVGPRRDDGYHDLVTVFQAISLYDDVTVCEADGPGRPGPDQREGRRGTWRPANLALKAARALARAAGLPRETTGPIEVAIRKRIPVAAGLAGGSADAAAALVACNELWHAGLSHGQQARSRRTSEVTSPSRCWAVRPSGWAGENANTGAGVG